MNFSRTQPFFIKAKKYLLNFLQTQLILTIIATPILVDWGLPLSLMTFVGNLIFTPALTIFLILSSLVFFTQLLHIPNHLLALSLDRFTQGWDDIIAHGSPTWLIEFCRPPTLILFAIPVITFGVLQIGKFKSHGTRIIAMSGILCVSLLGLWGWSFIDRPPINQTTATNIPQVIHLTPKGEQKELDLLQKNQKLDIHQEPDGRLTITDDGFFNRRHSPEKALEFELKPYLVKRFGKIHLKELVITRPGQRTMAGAIAFCTLFTVDKVTLPYFKKKLSKGGWRTFFGLKRLLEEKKIEFNRPNSLES